MIYLQYSLSSVQDFLIVVLTFSCCHPSPPRLTRLMPYLKHKEKKYKKVMANKKLLKNLPEELSGVRNVC